MIYHTPMRKLRTVQGLGRLHVVLTRSREVSRSLGILRKKLQTLQRKRARR